MGRDDKLEMTKSERKSLNISSYKTYIKGSILCLGRQEARVRQTRGVESS
jgi:hypothetical protein